MKSEYVGLSVNERVFGEKGFLQSELGLLNLVKSFKVFRKLRKDELVLKVRLRSQIHEVLSMMDKFEKGLPKATYGAKKIAKGTSKHHRAKPGSLQEEMDEIRERLARLGGSF